MNKKLRAWAVDTLFYIVGSALYAIGVHGFALNSGFVPGGISGVAMLLNHFFNLPIGVTSLVLNIPLALIGLRIIGAHFIGKSLYTMLINAVMMDLVFPHFPVYNGSPLLAALFTGIFLGAGLAIIYMRGSSTGGSDFIVMSIQKRQPHLSVGQLATVLDMVVILTGGLAYRNVDAVLYGIISSFATNITLDRVLYGSGRSKLAVIITSRGAEIATAITSVVYRGATLLPGKGAYTGNQRDVLLCACSKREISKVRQLVRAADPHAMLMITDTSEVVGQGFRQPPLPGNEDTLPVAGSHPDLQGKAGEDTGGPGAQA